VQDLPKREPDKVQITSKNAKNSKKEHKEEMSGQNQNLSVQKCHLGQRSGIGEGGDFVQNGGSIFWESGSE